MAGRVPSEEMCSVDEEEEEKCREMKVEVEEEEEEREGGGGGKEATRCRARREGKKTGVRERAVVISHSEGLGRGSEEGLLASSFCCESAKGPPVALLLGYGPSSSQQRICATRPCEILRSAVPASHPLSSPTQKKSEDFASSKSALPGAALSS